jgi:NAD(P)-dependent dehydrogenase (short-subunit alcohol dehydrogenase family)
MSNMQQSLAGRVAIVTGAAQGIGLGIAQTLLERGASVVRNDINEERLRESAALLKGLQAPTLEVVADVTSVSDVASMVKAAETEFGVVDILVNNAGILILKKFIDYTESEWDRVLGTNLRAVFVCTQAVLPGMIQARRGSIVNIASIAAFHTTTAHVPYAVAKAGVVALTRDVAYEVAEYGVRVNAVAPGPIATPMTLGERELSEAQLQAVPLGRWGRPSEIGAAVAFLASAEAEFITGTTLTVAGGADLRLRW